MDAMEVAIASINVDICEKIQNGARSQSLR